MLNTESNQSRRVSKTVSIRRQTIDTQQEMVPTLSVQGSNALDSERALEYQSSQQLQTPSYALSPKQRMQSTEGALSSSINWSLLGLPKSARSIKNSVSHTQIVMTGDGVRTPKNATVKIKPVRYCATPSADYVKNQVQFYRKKYGLTSNSQEKPDMRIVKPQNLLNDHQDTKDNTLSHSQSSTTFARPFSSKSIIGKSKISIFLSQIPQEHQIVPPMINNITSPSLRRIIEKNSSMQSYNQQVFGRQTAQVVTAPLQARSSDWGLHKQVVMGISRHVRVEKKGIVDLKRMGVQCADKLEKVLKKYSIIPNDRDEQMNQDMDIAFMYEKLFEQKINATNQVRLRQEKSQALQKDLKKFDLRTHYTKIQPPPSETQAIDGEFFKLSNASLKKLNRESIFAKQNDYDKLYAGAQRRCMQRYKQSGYQFDIESNDPIFHDEQSHFILKRILDVKPGNHYNKPHGVLSTVHSTTQSAVGTYINSQNLQQAQQMYSNQESLSEMPSEHYALNEQWNEEGQ